MSSNVDRRLCEYCSNIVFEKGGIELSSDDEPYQLLSYTTTLQQLQTSALEGCNWCCLVLQQPDAFTDLVDSDNVEIALKFGSLKLSFTPKGQNRFRLLVNGWSLDLTGFTYASDPASELVTARELQHRVGSPEAFSQAIKWIRECGTHEYCAQRADCQLPTRLIEVEPPNGSKSPRLIISRGRTGQYAALSYCWGPKQECVTTTGNILSFIQALPMKALAQSIKDAIFCTKQLGLRFLWVDSFCIVQDSDQDKMQEIREIRKIFERATVTIIAAAASNVHDGFLHDRPPPQPAFRIPVVHDGVSKGSIFLRPEGWYGDCVEPIAERAWALEEKLLSPRCLIYASHTLRWQCRSTKSNWGNSIHLPSGGTDLTLPVSYFQLESGVGCHKTLSLQDVKAHTNLWLGIASDYSFRSTTLPEDKLRALSGLAEKFHQQHGHQYLAGLWADPYLHRMLLWSPSRYVRANQEMYLAPTWSWASVNSGSAGPPIPEDSEWFDVDIVHISIDLASESLPFGQVVGGYINLQARLKDGWFAPPQYLSWQMEHQNEENPRFRARMNADLAEGPVICLGLSKRFYTYQEKRYEVVDGLIIAATHRKDHYERRGIFFGTEVEDWKTCPRQNIILL